MEDDAKLALRVSSLVEVEAFKKRCSDRLLSMSPIYEATRDLYNVCCILPQDPADEQFGDLAIRMSNFLEDAHRCHVDRRAAITDELGVLSVPMSVPLTHRAGMTERETCCMLYLNVPRWRGFERVGQLAELDEVARRHRLRCVEPGAIPES